MIVNAPRALRCVQAMKTALSAGDPDRRADRRLRVRGARRDQGSSRLGADRKVRREGRRRTGCGTSQEAFDEVEDEEDEHLYHTKGWCRELWIESLGIEGGIAARPRSARTRRDVRDRGAAAPKESAALTPRTLMHAAKRKEPPVQSKQRSRPAGRRRSSNPRAHARP